MSGPRFMEVGMDLLVLALHKGTVTLERVERELAGHLSKGQLARLRSVFKKEDPR